MLFIYNKWDDTSKLHQNSSKSLEVTRNSILEADQMWRLELDPQGSLCYRIYNFYHETSKITFQSDALRMTDRSSYHTDELWSFQRDGRGYYFIVRCLKGGIDRGKRITLDDDGTLSVKEGYGADKQLWTLTYVEDKDAGIYLEFEF